MLQDQFTHSVVTLKEKKRNFRTTYTLKQDMNYGLAGLHKRKVFFDSGSK